MLAVGPGGFDKDGKRIALGVAVGDKVLIPQVGVPWPLSFCSPSTWTGSGFDGKGYISGSTASREQICEQFLTRTVYSLDNC